MRKISVFLCSLFSLSLVGVAEADIRARSIDQFCPKVQSAGAESSTIYKQSAPLRAGGVGTPLIGYRQEPTLIFNKRNFTGGTHTIYDGAGNSLARCPVLSAEGHQGRARCTIQTRTLRRAAVRNTKSPSVYFKISNNLCIKVPDAGVCIGSVKGFCDRKIT